MALEFGEDYVESQFDFDRIADIAFQRDSTGAYNTVQAEITNQSQEAIGLTTQMVAVDEATGADIWYGEIAALQLAPFEPWSRPEFIYEFPSSGNVRIELRVLESALPADMSLADATDSSRAQLTHVAPAELFTI